jgi:hypothetical protein
VVLAAHSDCIDLHRRAAKNVLRFCSTVDQKGIIKIRLTMNLVGERRRIRLRGGGFIIVSSQSD